MAWQHCAKLPSKVEVPNPAWLAAARRASFVSIHMKRVVEPELMDTEEQAQAYAAADFESAHAMYPRVFAEKFPRRAPRARVLDLGCGPCDVTLRFAKANPAYTFHAVDGSAAML